MKNNKVNIIFSIIYEVLAVISLVILIPEMITGFNKYGLKEHTVLYMVVLIIAILVCMITTFLGAITQIIGGFILAGAASIGVVVLGFLCLIETLFEGYTSEYPMLFLFIVLFGFSVAEIIIGFRRNKASRLTIQQQ